MVVGYIFKNNECLKVAKMLLGDDTSFDVIKDNDKSGEGFYVNSHIESKLKGYGLLDKLTTPLFESLTKGKWYWYGKSLLNYVGMEDGLLRAYGFCRNKWTEVANFGVTPNEWSVAKHSVVQTALIEEAEQRGIDYGTTLKYNDKPNEEFTVIKNSLPKWSYQPLDNSLWFHGNIVFMDGKWVEVVNNEKYEIILPKVWEGKVVIKYR